MADIPVPELCRLEFWTPTGWVTAHAGVALLHPARYVERLGTRGKIGRVTLLDTGTTIQPPCSTCGEHHEPPFGSCLI